MRHYPCTAQQLALPSLLLLITVAIAACQQTSQPDQSATMDEPVTETTDHSDQVTIANDGEPNDIASRDSQQQITQSLNDFSEASQSTTIHYQSETGDTLTVIYQPNDEEGIEATVILATGEKLTLIADAPDAINSQNVLFHSADSSVELISHGGGSSVDLVQQAQAMHYLMRDSSH